MRKDGVRMLVEHRPEESLKALIETSILNNNQRNDITMNEIVE
jgi:hypothetical protein